jgi:uncharacterized damage-inducible protein DinB
MKEQLLQFAQYNVWANKLMIDALLLLTESQLEMKIESSFADLKLTTYHCWNAEDVWLQRLQNVPKPIWRQNTFTGTFAEACLAWEAASAGLLELVTAMNTDDDAKAICSYSDFTGNPYQMPVSQLLLHAFNHASYHRGQLVTMLRQVGVRDIPRTDFIIFARKFL